MDVKKNMRDHPTLHFKRCNLKHT